MLRIAQDWEPEVALCRCDVNRLGFKPGSFDYVISSMFFHHLSDEQVVRLPDEFAVDDANGVVAELRVLLGPDAIVV